MTHSIKDTVSAVKEKIVSGTALLFQTIQVYRDDTTIIFAWKKESDEKEKNYLPQPQNFLNISTKPLR